MYTIIPLLLAHIQELNKQISFLFYSLKIYKIIGFDMDIKFISYRIIGLGIDMSLYSIRYPITHPIFFSQKYI